MVCDAPGRVLRVDPASATVTADVSITKPQHVSAASSGVWVSAQEGLFQLDPMSLATKRTVAGVGVGFVGGIRADDAGVWAHRASPFLTRIDGASGSQTAIISAPFDGGGDVAVDGHYLWATLPDESAVVRLDIPDSP